MKNTVQYLEVEDRDRMQDLEQECRNDWALDDKKVKQVLAFGERLGLDRDQCLEALSGHDAEETLPNFRSFVGAIELAIELIGLYSVDRLNKELYRLQDLNTHEPHTEAPVVCWSEVQLPGGAKISVTARSGSTAEEVVEVTLVLASAINSLREFGIKPKKF